MERAVSVCSVQSCYRGSDDASMTSEKSDGSSSRSSSLVTFPSNRGIIRHNDVSSDESMCYDEAGTKKRPSVHFQKNESDVAAASSFSRINRRIRRSLRDAEFPLSDISADKSTASQAVAFVIRASRRGVVPLCAEVADLLKEKNMLENVVSEQKQEIVQLMDSQVIPRTPSPPPPEMADFSMQTVQDMDCQTMMLTDASIQTEKIVLPCAQVKLLDENDKIEAKATDLAGVEFECGSEYSIQCLCPKMATTSTQNPVLVSVATNTTDLKRFSSELGYYDHHRLEQRHKALEIKHKNLKTETKEQTSKNGRLESDLDTAKLEIVSLQKAIQDIQEKEYERVKEEERLKREETYSVDVNNDDDTNDDDSDVSDYVKRRSDVIVTDGRQERRLYPVNQQRSQKSVRSSIFPGPVLGCKCQMCSAFFKSSGLLGFACSPYVTDSSGRNPVLRDLRKLVSLQNSKLQVHPNDHVLVKNNKVGVVRYVGHLDGVGTPSVVYVGIELETPTGKHDGYLHGKRYFFSPQNHGLFLPLQDVLCVINKKLALPAAHQRYPAIGSSRSNGQSAPLERTKRYISHRARTSSTMTSSSTDSSSDDSRLPAVTTR